MGRSAIINCTHLDADNRSFHTTTEITMVFQEKNILFKALESPTNVFTPACINQLLLIC